MKKKVLTVISLLALMSLLSGCMMGQGSTLEAMFGKPQNNESSAGINSGSNGKTVTISQEEYDRLSKFSDLADLYDAAEYYFYKEPDGNKMMEYAAKGLLAGLEDPYTFYYNPEEFEQMWKDDEGKYVGIGVMILANNKTGICTISRVFKGSPAEEAGVMRGDILYRVGEDLFVTSENLTEAVNIMRGEPGTTVDVTFLRNEEEITFNIRREQVNVNQVESTMLTENIGYIALYEFAGVADQEFKNEFSDLVEKGAKSLIIDLRDNTGGWVDQAVRIGDLFLDAGDLCYLVYRDGTEDHIYKTTDGKTDIELTIIVNEMSASASEILTAALKERAGATVVGTNSFGKGIVQNVLYIGKEGAGFQITIAEYLTPLGNHVHEIGIAPDVNIERPEGDNGTYNFADLEKDVQLKKALEIAADKLK